MTKPPSTPTCSPIKIRLSVVPLNLSCTGSETPCSFVLLPYIHCLPFAFARFLESFPHAAI